MKFEGNFEDVNLKMGELTKSISKPINQRIRSNTFMDVCGDIGMEGSLSVSPSKKRGRISSFFSGCKKMKNLPSNFKR
jgi:hypothetical protein